MNPRGAGKPRDGKGDYRGDVRGSGTAAEILANKIAELEEHIKYLEEQQAKESPKERTLTEMKNLSTKNIAYKELINKLRHELDDKGTEMEELLQLKHFAEEFKMSNETKVEELGDVLSRCSPRVKKHMKIIIDDKMSTEDLKDALKIILLKLDDDIAWPEILHTIKKVKGGEIFEKLLGGLGIIPKPVAVEIDIDSAPSDTDEDDKEVEEVKDKMVKECTTDVVVKEGKDVVIATSGMTNKGLDSATKTKMS